MYSTLIFESMERLKKQTSKRKNGSSQRPGGRTLTKLETKVLKSHAAMDSNARRGNIPVLRAVFFKGTQCPVLRLKLALFAINSSVGGVINTVCAINLANLIAGTAWDDVFEEFRILRAHLEYRPHQIHYSSVVTARDMACYVDYDDSTAGTSKNAVWAYDNAVIINTNENHSLPEVLPDFVPDQQWYNSQTDQATSVAWCKFYADGCSGSQSYGEVFGWMDVQFRST